MLKLLRVTTTTSLPPPLFPVSFHPPSSSIPTTTVPSYTHFFCATFRVDVEIVVGFR
ncbi:hypothetical protein Scep_001004 [Stephania cephalantha]|uniref:Uncharacterized protein n=1 Tax=Stephania cephalantha TaxID=152367 RepID=A0AAP0L8K0_9MAGN